MATKLRVLYREFGPSPWLDNLTRGHLNIGRLAPFVGAGIRGVPASPTNSAKAIEGSRDHEADFAQLLVHDSDGLRSLGEKAPHTVGR
jgi:transaldolase